MKITDMRAAYLNVPLKALSPPAIGGETSAHHTLVVVDTDEGIRGIGTIDVATGPGLGIEIDADRLAFGLAEATA